MNNVRPLRDLVLVEAVDKNTKDSLIMQVESMRSEVIYGKVVSVGPNCDSVKEGDTVLLPKTLETIPAKQYIVPEHVIIGILEQ